MKTIAIIIGAATLAACAITSKPEPGVALGKLRFSIDGETGLCFASMNSSGYGGLQVTSITNVPCTPGVVRAAQ